MKLKLVGAQQTLVCACCRERYTRGAWMCCAPPDGMTWDRWREQWTVQDGRIRCPRCTGAFKTAPVGEWSDVKTFCDRLARTKGTKGQRLPYPED